MPPTTLPSGRTETLEQTKKRARELTGTVSASDLTTPTEAVNPPAPVTPEPSNRLQGMIGNVARDTQGFITNQSEEAKQAQELAGLMGSQTFDSAGQRASLNEQYNVPTNLRELQDIQLQLADRGTQTEIQKSRIESAAGQTMAQAQREVTQADREAAIRDAGLAARASVIQGNIETASTLINQAMQDFYQDRTAYNNNLINQLNYFQGIADDQTAQLLEQEKRAYEEDQARILRAQSLVDSAVSSGYLFGGDLEKILTIGDPEVQAEMVQQTIARGIQKDIAAAKAAAAASGYKSPELKNFGTSDEPIWKQWNSELAIWEDVSGIDPSMMGGEDPQQALDQFSFLRDTTSRILGNEEAGYEPLYKASGKGVWDRAASFFVGDSKYNRLEAQVDPLRTNMLTLMTDPTVKQFFGPQMSDADVRLMTAAGTSLRPNSQSPEELKAEVTRIDDLLNRAQTAVKNGLQAQRTRQPVVTGNVVTAPDGTQIEIID